MADAMCWADVSVNAGGSTCWELMTLGVPMIVARLDPDETGNAVTLPAAGLAIGASSPLEAGRGIDGLLCDATLRERLSRQGMQLVDGTGAARAAESLARLLTRVDEVVHERR